MIKGLENYIDFKKKQFFWEIQLSRKRYQTNNMKTLRLRNLNT